MSAKNQSLSINLIMNSAINGTNFLQTSVNKLHTYAKKVENIALLGRTKFPTLHSNVNKLSVGLGGLKRQTAKISANPINLGLSGSHQKLKLVKKDITSIAQKSREARNYSKLWADDLKRGSAYANTKVKQTGGYISTKAKVGATIATAGVLGAMSTLNPIDKAIEFESAMAEVVKATNATKPQRLQLRNNILNQVSKGSLLEPSQIAEIQASGGRSGVSIADLPQFTNMVSKASIALDIKDYGVVARDFSKMAERMNVPISKVDVFTNSFTALENSGSNSGVDMINTTARLSNRYKMLDFKPKNASAISNYMNTLEVTPELAASSFKILTDRMIQTNSQFGYFDRLKTQGAGSLKGIIKDITSSMNNGQIIKAFGTKGAGIITAMSGNFKTLDKSLAVVGTKQMRIEFDEKYKPKKLIGGLGNFMSAVDNEYKVKTGTTEARETMARGKTTVGMIGVGDELKKPYIALYEATSQAITGVTLFYKSNKELINTLAPIALGIGATALAIKAISTVLNPFIGLARGAWKFRSQLKTGAIFAYKIALSGLSATGRVVGLAMGSVATMIRGFSLATSLATAKQWLFNIALNANPIGLVIAGVGALITAGVLLYKNWDTIKAKASVIWTSITNTIKSPFVSLFSWIENKFNAVMGIVNKVKSIASNVSNLGSTALNGVKNGASNAWSSTKNYFGFGESKSQTLKPVKSINSPWSVDYKSPVNNPTYKKVSGGIEPLSTPQAMNDFSIPTLKLQTLDEATAEAEETGRQKMIRNAQAVAEVNAQVNPNSQKTITNHFNISVTSTDGVIDEDALMAQFVRIRNKVEHEEQDLQFSDVG